MDATRFQLWPAGWSRKRRSAVVAFGLFMLYVQSVYFTGFYIPEEEYWFPFWTGMTVDDRLLSLVLALAANIGLIATPFLRAPGHLLRFLLIASLVSGAVVSLAWVADNLWGWIEGAVQYPEFLIRTLLSQGPSTAIYYTVFGLHISGELWRRLGPIVGPMAAAAHELGNDARGDRSLSMLEWISTTTG